MEGVSNRILIAGAAGFGNAGDEATTQAMVSHLRERIPGVEITLVSGDPPSVNPRALAEAVRQAGLVILAGGIFEDSSGFDPAAILTREHRGLSFYLGPALLAAIWGRPLMLYAVGAGGLVSEQGRLYTKVAGDLAARITVRDGASQKLFVSLGVSAEKIAVTADPCFDFAPATELPGLPAVREWKSGGPAVAVCLRDWNTEVAAALDDFLLDEGGRILFVPLGGSDDLEVARRVYTQMRFRERAAILEEPCTPAAAAAGVLAHADLVLGMRLHSLIFSLAARVPFVALESEPTVGGVADLAGLREFTLPFGGTEAYVIAGRLRWALRQKARFQTLAVVDELRRRARENAGIAAAVLRQGDTAAAYGPDAHGAIGQLVMARLEEDGHTAQLALDLEIARYARQETAAQLAICQQLLARYESQTFAGMAKKALGFFQRRTPTGN